jgi:uncharacterized membrane protein
MDFTFSMDNYYLLGAIALAVILIVVGAVMYLRNRDSAPAESDAGAVYQEVMQDEPPGPEPHGEDDHAHTE